jgi:hypothetical protein
LADSDISTEKNLPRAPTRYKVDGLVARRAEIATAPADDPGCCAVRAEQERQALSTFSRTKQ